MTDERWSLTDCVERLRRFTEARDWSKFHQPKELATALAIEAAELQEVMLWKTDAEVARLTDEAPLSERLGEEIADVGIFLLLLADKLDLDLREAVLSKIDANERRYAASEHRGKAEKAPRGPSA